MRNAIAIKAPEKSVFPEFDAVLKKIQFFSTADFYVEIGFAQRKLERQDECKAAFQSHLRQKQAMSS